MPQPLCPRLIDIPPVRPRTRFSHSPPPLDEYKHRRITHAAKDSSHDKHIPAPHAIFPRGDPIVDCETQCIPYQDQRSDQLAAEITVRRCGILDGSGQAQC